MSLPHSLLLNAWTGVNAAQGDLKAEAAKWGARPGLPHSQQALAFQPPANPKDWSHPDVGYGILLPDSDDPYLSPAAKAAGEDAPPPVRALLAARPETVVLRWLPGLKSRFLRRYFADGTNQDPAIGLSAFGVAKGWSPVMSPSSGAPR